MPAGVRKIIYRGGSSNKNKGKTVGGGSRAVRTNLLVSVLYGVGFVVVVAVLREDLWSGRDGSEGNRR